MGQARSVETILRDLYKAAKPGIRGSVWGTHLDLLARYVVTADLEEWEHRAFDWSAEVDLSALPDDVRRLNLGDENRAVWRPTTEDERIALMPAVVSELLKAVEPPTPAPFLVRTSQSKDRAPDAMHRPETSGVVRLHPDAGHAQGGRVRVTTANGSVVATVEHDEHLRMDVVDLAPEDHAGGLSLNAWDGVDDQTGAPIRDGIPCQVETL